MIFLGTFTVLFIVWCGAFINPRTRDGAGMLAYLPGLVLMALFGRWNWVARTLASPVIVSYLINRAERTPYAHIYNGGDLYMRRFWLFNPYPVGREGKRQWWRFPISIRLHHIVKPDQDRHNHSHPWNARTIILRGRYSERRRNGIFWREAGETATLSHDDFHRILSVSEGGCWTMFITGRYRHTWGFDVDGKFVPWKEYLK